MKIRFASYLIQKINSAKAFTIILIFISCRIIDAQDLTELYRDILPNKVKNNETYLTQTSTILEQCAQVHPELFYFYIENLKARFGGENGDKYFINFSGIIGSYETDRRKWVNKVTKEIEDEPIDPELKEICIEFMDDNKGNLRKESAKIEWNHVDRNLMDFIVVRYYLKDKNLIYRSEEDFSAKRRVIEEKITVQLNEAAKDSLEYNEEKLNEFVKYWYFPERLNEKLKTSAAVIKVLRSIYDIKYRSRFVASIGYSYQRNYLSAGESVYGTPLYGKPEYEFSIQPFSAALSYKHFFSNYLGLMYYFNFQLAFGYGVGNQDIQILEESSYRKTKIDGVPNRNEVYEFTNNKIKINKLYFASLDITAAVPVYFLNKDLLMDLGLGAAFQNTNYELYYDYEYRKFDSEFLGPRMIKSEAGTDVTKSETSTDFLVYPVVNLKYYFLNPLALQLGITTYSVSLNLGINL